MKRIVQILIGILIILCPSLFAQGLKYDGPEDGAGDLILLREGFMDGNRVQLLFKNNTELGDFPRTDAARWPAGVTGNMMHDGLALLVGARVYLKDKTVPVTDPGQIQALGAMGLLDTLYYNQTSYREEMDFDPTGQIRWGLYPAPGYMNELCETPALSNDPNSWPPAPGWPFRGFEKHWPGEWDGRFGRGQIRADLEAYIVANDAQDQEYLGSDDVVRYYPKGPNVKIGDINSRVSIQKGLPWGGLGIRVKQRLFQWNNPLAQDCIFSEYTIANTSDYDLVDVAFGYHIDNDIGGENGGEAGSFDKIEDLAYTWDTDGVGNTGYPTGTQGFAFLESPGIYNDQIDNDDDGIMNEARNNTAGKFLTDPFAEIADKDKFLQFYGLKETDVKPHWSGDEDGDWIDGEDENGNGVYDASEYAGDDVGLDGVAPGEENYTGPDEDRTECNHQPDINEQGYAEPNFGWTDIAETDMLGLTTLLFFEIPQGPHPPPYLTWFRNDKSMWNRMTLDTLHEIAAINQFNNLGELFASAIFPLASKQTEFISIAELHSYDDFTGLNSIAAAPALFSLKKTVQVIYEKDYQFAQPPEMPKLTAIPGDGFVQLIWDDRSIKLTRESFLNNENDFEGYKLYRATDKDFTDPVVITDGYGTKTIKKPIFQCDLKNGRKGFTNYGLINGMGYNLGDDSGISFSFRDETVLNGRTYYYAIVAYDYGIPPGKLKGSSVVSADPNYGIGPAENNVVIRKDEFEKIKFIDRNVAIVVPGVKAAGITVQGDILVDDSQVTGVGTITPELVLPETITKGQKYRVEFDTTCFEPLTVYKLSPIYQFTTSGIYVYDMTDGHRLVYSDIIARDEDGRPITQNFNTVSELSMDRSYYHLATSGPRYTDIFEGIRLKVQLGVEKAIYDTLNSGWMTGNSPMKITYSSQAFPYYPWDYNIVFSDHPIFTGVVSKSSPGIRDDDGTAVLGSSRIFNQEFNFKVENLTSPLDSLGNHELMDMIVYDIDKDKVYNPLVDKVMVGRTTDGYFEYTIFTIDFRNLQSLDEMPKNNDVYCIRFKRPFLESDAIDMTFNIEESVDNKTLEKDMDSIRVVPNPYIATNVMEPSVVNTSLNQSRRLMFTNLPEKCTVKIFTVNGILIRELHSPDDVLTSYNGYGQQTNGMLQWDMLTKEGLEIAAGMYIYFVKDDITHKEKIGKFGVIK